MKIVPEQLHEHGYQLLERLDHLELVPFIQIYLKKKTAFSIFYYLINFMMFGVIIFFLFQGYGRPEFHFGEHFAHVGYGFALAFLLLPLHKYIHVLAYKSLGAVNTSYSVNLNKFYFMAVDDQFVADKREFQILALSPFMVINIFLSGLLFLVSTGWILTVISIIFMHTAICSGDFGFLSYFAFQKD